MTRLLPLDPRSVGKEPDYRFTLANERTFLAWERTAVSMMVAGALLLLWAGRHDDELHSPATPPDSVPQVALTRVIGGLSVVFSAVALAVVIVRLLN